MADHTDILEIDPVLATYEIVVEIDEPRVKQLVNFELANVPTDNVPPTVTFVDPAPGTATHKTQPIVVDVTDDVELRATLVLVRYEGTVPYEVAWDGGAFAANYASASRAAIAGGFRYTLRRRGGWPSTPTIRVVAIDAAGNEAA